MSQPGHMVRVLLAWVALAGALVSAAVQIVAPLLRPDIDFVHGALSEYAVGPWGWFNSLGFVGLGVAAAANGLALRLQGIPSPWTPLGSAALLIAAVFSLATAWYPLGASGPWSPLGDAHQSAATLAAASFLAAMVAFVPAFRAASHWRGFWLPTALLAITGIAFALLTQARILRPEFGIPFGLAMRGVSLSLGLWVLLVAVRLVQITIETGPGPRE